ncbi:MAG: hypothetical protein IKU55_05990 [Clostridia bacterium]|nr:hypothetical protein [Clostridia bacterium]
MERRENIKKRQKAAIAWGADGSIVRYFNISIYDGEGLDIYIFEVGGQVEATREQVLAIAVRMVDNLG